MEMVQAKQLVFEYEKRDEDGNVIGSSRAIDQVDLDVFDMQDRLRNAFPHLLEIRREILRKADYSKEYSAQQELDPFELCCAFLKEIDEEEKAVLQDVINTVREMDGRQEVLKR